MVFSVLNEPTSVPYEKGLLLYSLLSQSKLVSFDFRFTIALLFGFQNDEISKDNGLKLTELVSKSIICKTTTGQSKTITSVCN